MTGQRTAVFLQVLAGRIKGPLIVVWDRGTMHKGDAIRQVLQRHPRLRIQWLPPYAPELNPTEYLFTHLKADRLANFAPRDVPELLARSTREVARIQRDQARLRSFLFSSPLFSRTRTLLF